MSRLDISYTRFEICELILVLTLMSNSFLMMLILDTLLPYEICTSFICIISFIQTSLQPFLCKFMGVRESFEVGINLCFESFIMGRFKILKSINNPFLLMSILNSKLIFLKCILQVHLPQVSHTNLKCLLLILISLINSNPLLQPSSCSSLHGSLRTLLQILILPTLLHLCLLSNKHLPISIFILQIISFLLKMLDS